MDPKANSLMGRILSRISRTSRKLGALRVVDRRRLWTRQEEEHLRKIFEYLRIDCVFDVGANRGQYAEMLRRRVGYRGQIVSFEPNPAVASELERRSRYDSLWKVERVALAKQTGTRNFNVMKYDEFSSLGSPNHEDVSIFKNLNVIQDSITVSTRTLTDAITGYRDEFGFERPFLKMDTQGFDVEVFESGGKEVELFSGMQSELSFMKIYNESIDFRDTLEVYKGKGFMLSALVANNAGHFPRLIEMDAILIRKDLFRDV